VDRAYAEYVVNGLSAEESGAPCDGVKGLFAFYPHPLAHLIVASTDPMHAFYNVITDGNKTLRPTNSGDTNLGSCSNRTYKQDVINDCQSDRTHKKLWSGDTADDVPPWVFTKVECVEADKRMNSIIGPPGTNRIQRVMKAGHAANTHDTLEWAFTFARWCWHGFGTAVYVDNLLEIFDVLNILTSSSLKIATVIMSLIFSKLL
jgi:hypothetical protein